MCSLGLASLISILPEDAANSDATDVDISMHLPFEGYQPYPRFWRFRRAPSRFIWFAIGAIAATWFHKSRSEDGGHRCLRHKNINSLPPPDNYGQDSRTLSAHSDAAVTYPHHPAYSASILPSWSLPNPMADRWEDPKSKMKQLRQEAEETLAEVSESTLDGMISIVELAKAKLAERRAAVERDARLRRMEEEKRGTEQLPHHIV